MYKKHHANVLESRKRSEIGVSRHMGHLSPLKRTLSKKTKTSWSKLRF